MCVTRRTKQVHRHELVRIRGGIYANDLAQVTNVDESNTHVWVRLVPRINLNDLCESKVFNPCFLLSMIFLIFVFLGRTDSEKKTMCCKFTFKRNGICYI
jgi:hypothetical protein